MSIIVPSLSIVPSLVIRLGLILVLLNARYFDVAPGISGGDFMLGGPKRAAKKIVSTVG
jgi:hypothetical protein